MYNKTLTDILESEPHFFIAGRTGSGKSTLLNNIIIALSSRYTANALQFYFIDLKKVELSLYKPLKHCKKYAETSAEALKVLELLTAITESRYNRMKRNKKRFFEGSCIYLIVDELADLMLSAERKQIEKHLQHLAQIGRAANVHLIFATQIIRAETLKTTITGNINGRFALQTETTLDSQKIINSPLAASLPKHGKALIKTSNGLNYFDFPYYNEQQVIEHVSKHKKTFFDRLNPF